MKAEKRTEKYARNRLFSARIRGLVRTIAVEGCIPDGRNVTLTARPILLALPAGCFALCLGATGCALRASTDFGPGDETAHQSVSAGAGPFHNLLGADRQGEGSGNESASVGGGTGANGWR